MQIYNTFLKKYSTIFHYQQSVRVKLLYSLCGGRGIMRLQNGTKAGLWFGLKNLHKINRNLKSTTTLTVLNLQNMVSIWSSERVQEHTRMEPNTAHFRLPASQQHPRSVHTWHRDKLTTHIHFIKTKTQSIQWAGNWKSFSFELLRAVQSLPADSTGGLGHLYSRRMPFLSPCSPFLPLSSISVYLPSRIHSPLLTASHPPFSRSRLSLHLIYIFVLFIYISINLESTCDRLRARFPDVRREQNPGMCGAFAFAVELHHLFLIHFASFTSSPPPAPFFPIRSLLPQQMFSNGGKRVKTAAQSATRETIGRRSWEITVVGGGHWKLQRQNRRVLSLSFFSSSPSVALSSLS